MIGGKRAVATVASVVALTSAVAQSPGTVERGRALLEANCARCHAIAKAGDSPHAQAPPFRDLNRRYPVEQLAESLAEGIVTGHADMPQFVFPPADVNAIIAYLKSIAP
jgi:mono/diheme cytochrome c family protein